MKRFGLFLLVALFAISFTACQGESTEESAAGTDAAGNVTNPATNDGPTQPAVNTAQPAPSQTSHADKAKELPQTTAEWGSTEYNFGKTAQKEKVEQKFKVKNTGSEDLHIVHVKTSCGCTAPDWSKDPIAPGQEGYVDLVFTPKQTDKGNLRKTATVYANTGGNFTQILTLVGEVEAGEEAPAN